MCASGFASSALSLTCCPTSCGHSTIILEWMKLYHQSLLGLLALSVCVHTCCCGGGTHVCVCLHNFVHVVQGTKYTYYIGKSGSSKESQISSFSWMSWSQHLRQATKTYVLFWGFFFSSCNQELLPLTNCFLLHVYQAQVTWHHAHIFSSGIRSLLSVLGYQTQDRSIGGLPWFQIPCWSFPPPLFCSGSSLPPTHSWSFRLC